MFRYTFKNTLGTFLAFKTNDQVQKFDSAILLLNSKCLARKRTCIGGVTIMINSPHFSPFKKTFNHEKLL